MEILVETPLTQLDADDDTASPIYLSGPFELRLDWWKDGMAGGRKLKVWAGRMGSVRIARAMQQAMREIPRLDALFDFGTVVRDPNAPSKKVEPFYFDSRRGW
ncbi:MAG: hypothetical protein VCE12_05530, partial [Candidatus Latescibacterota bacterium]